MANALPCVARTWQNHKMIEELLPSNVISVEAWGDDLSASLFPEEAAQFDWAIESRMREFITARSCARQALSKLGLPRVPILRGANREPLWPHNVVGSITHCRGFRAAAVAMQPEVWAVGIDAEIHAALPAGVDKHVLLEQEIAWVQHEPQGLHWDRILFSAKESVYKAWFPRTRRWLGFEDLAIVTRPREGEFAVRLLVAPPLICGRPLAEFKGRFLVRRGLVLTATVISRLQLFPE